MTNQPGERALACLQSHRRGALRSPRAGFSRRQILRLGSVMGATLAGDGRKRWRAPAPVQAGAVQQPQTSHAQSRTAPSRNWLPSMTSISRSWRDGA
jgi:hypothetical protein